MNYYIHNNKILFSNHEYKNLQSIPRSEAEKHEGIIYHLAKLNRSDSRRSFLISDPSLLFIEVEDLNLLRQPAGIKYDISDWLKQKIITKSVCGINTEYPNWEVLLDYTPPLRWKINIAGLGDVGGMLLTGLRLLGGQSISEIGIYDLDPNKISRWFSESNQILIPGMEANMPAVREIKESEIFHCDMFVFCVSVGVPPVGEEHGDVRMMQYKGNSKVISIYARKAREAGFRGVFSVVSDPVDLLCSSALAESNKDSSGNYDFKGLAPEQIRGYGLGVMNARAFFYSALDEKYAHFKQEGRVYGPHGKGLVVADSISNYNEELSLDLTKKTIEANLDIRKTGFKPYIAPALSSGSFSLLATIRGEWHYSATFIGGVFMGARNRLTPLGTELERLDIPNPLYKRLNESYEGLKSQNGTT